MLQQFAVEIVDLALLSLDDERQLLNVVSVSNKLDLVKIAARYIYVQLEIVVCYPEILHLV